MRLGLSCLGAQGQLDSATTATSDSRRIVSFNPVAESGIRFLWSAISTAQQAQLNNTQSLLEFLRGWRGREDANAACSGPGTCLYRSRTNVLGDIVNSAAAYVGAPTRNYTDNDYDSFKSAQASRVPTLYVGANDGMLHAFDANPATGGAERWAYIPNLLMGRIKELSYKVNGTPAFSHSFYVDGTPTTGDVDFNNFTNTVGSSGPSDWRTILVSGLNRGGMGFFALDVTIPATVTTNINAVTSKVLWEFPNSNNLTHLPHVNKVGFSYGKPIITKLPTYGWVVLVTSGYNNGVGTDSSGGDGRGRLFILDAKTGEVLKVMQTLLDQGAYKIIVGTSAFTAEGPNRAFLEELAAKIGPEKILLALDSKHGKIVIRGWQEATNFTAEEIINSLEPYCRGFLCTYVDKEGMMQGTDIGWFTRLRAALPETHELTAAGGVTTLDDVRALRSINIHTALGMAIYTGRLDLAELRAML